MNKLKQKWLCEIMGIHSWTSKGEEGIPFPPIQTFSEYLEFNKLYCKRCGRISYVSKREIKKASDTEKRMLDLRERLKKIKRMNDGN